MKTLRQLIKLNNKILVEVSKDTGIHIATLSKFQTGKQKPSKLQRSILEKYFGEPFEYISDLEMERTARLVTEERVAELEKLNKELWSMYSEVTDKLRKIEQIIKGY